MSVTVRMVEPGDESAWAELYAGYRAFYRLADDASAVATTWQWCAMASTDSSDLWPWMTLAGPSR